MKKTKRILNATVFSLSLIFSTTCASAKGFSDFLNSTTEKVNDLKSKAEQKGSELKSKIEDVTSDSIGNVSDKVNTISDKITGFYDNAAELVASLNKALEDPSPEDVYYIGRSVAANILSNYPAYENPELEKYLNKICQAIVLNSVEQAPYNGYHVKVLDSSEINAFSTPSGHILITRGLVSCADSEDALAAVIAHEIAHIQLEHGLNSIKGDRISSAAKLTAQKTSDAMGLDSVTAFLDSVSDSLLSKMEEGYSQSQEYEADKKALELMANAGYSPSAMVSMLQKMETVGEFKTHPAPENRIKNVNVYLKKYKVNDTTSYRTERYSKIIKH